MTTDSKSATPAATNTLQSLPGTVIDGHPDALRAVEQVDRFRPFLQRKHDEAYEAVRRSHRVEPDPDFDATQKQSASREARLVSAAAIDEANHADQRQLAEIAKLEKKLEAKTQLRDQQKVTLGDRMDQEAQLRGHPQPKIEGWVVAVLATALAVISTLSLHDAFFAPLFPGKLLLSLSIALVAALLITLGFVVEPVMVAKDPVIGQRRWPRLIIKALITLVIGAGFVLVREQFVTTPAEAAVSYGLMCLELAVMVGVEAYCHHMSVAIERHRKEALGQQRAAGLVTSMEKQLAGTKTEIDEIEVALTQKRDEMRRREDLRRAAGLLEDAAVTSVDSGLRKGYETNRGMTYGALTVPTEPATILDRLVPTGRNGILKTPA